MRSGRVLNAEESAGSDAARAVGEAPPAPSSQLATAAGATATSRPAAEVRWKRRSPDVPLSELRDPRYGLNSLLAELGVPRAWFPWFRNSYRVGRGCVTLYALPERAETLEAALRSGQLSHPAGCTVEVLYRPQSPLLVVSSREEEDRLNLA